MPGYWCFMCHQPRSQCEPGDGTCVKVDEMANADIPPRKTPFVHVVGGTTAQSARLDKTRKFDRDMHAYREARRAGEQPEMVSEEAVRKNRQLREVAERVEVVHGPEAVPEVTHG